MLANQRYRFSLAIAAFLLAAVTGSAQSGEPPRLVSGAERGVRPEVLLVNPTLRFLAYPRGSTYGVRVAAGDVTGDGAAEIITALGPGGRPEVRVFHAASGRRLESFLAYGSSFRGGVNVAVGDVNGDGRAEIVTGPGAGGGPHVRVFDGAGGRRLESFPAYGTTFRGGVFVAAGDLDGDGAAEVITGPGPGAALGVRVFDASDGRRLDRLFAFEPSFLGGVYVAAGDADYEGDSDGADFLTARASAGPPTMRVRDGTSNTILLSLSAGTYGRGGLRVASGDFNGDGQDDVLAVGAEGSHKAPQVFDGRTRERLRFEPVPQGVDGADYLLWQLVNR